MTTPSRGGVLREGYDYDFSRADPATGAHVDPAWCALYETATVAASTGELGPMLATSWRYLPERLEWRFTPRSNAYFHSGDRCDAEAMAQAYEVHSDPVVSPMNAFFWKPIRAVATDGEELVVSLHHPCVGLPRLLRSWHSAIHSPARRAALGDHYGFADADGTGPFRFQELEVGEHFDVARWDDYRGAGVGWFANDGPALLDGIRWIPLVDEAERASALEAGDIHSVQNPSLLDVERLKENPDLRVVEYQQSSLAYFALDQLHPDLRFDDVNVRRAISHAIDRTRIVSEELLGHGTAAYGPIPSESRWYEPTVADFNEYNPGLAESLLDAAGLTRGSDGTRLRFPVRVLHDSTLLRVAQSIGDMLAAIGVLIEVSVATDFASFYGSLDQHPPAFLSKWFWPEPVDAIVGFVASWAHDGPNWQRASNHAIDDACIRWQTAPSATAEAQAAGDLQVLIAEHLPLVPLYFPSAVWACHRSVRGWDPTPTNLYPFYNDVWIRPTDHPPR